MNRMAVFLRHSLRRSINAHKRFSTQKNLSSADIKCTNKAKERLKKILDRQERLRIEVEGGGCSGFEYKLLIDKNLNDDDLIWSEDGIRIVIDEMSLKYLRGATVDYAEDLMKASFRIINNPIAEKGCSCGASFALKMD